MRVIGPKTGERSDLRASSWQSNEFSKDFINAIGRAGCFDYGGVLRDIDRGLSRHDIAQTLESEGFGAVKKSTVASVLDRLKSNDNI